MPSAMSAIEELANRVRQLIKPEMPTTFVDKIKKLPDLMKLASFSPKIVKQGLCQEVIHTDHADLLSLPILQCWPADGDLASEPTDMRPPSSPVVEAEGARQRTGRK